MHMPNMIISGGQSGVDYCALVAARECGIQTGGAAPKGYLVLNEDGQIASNPKLKDFGLIDISKKDWKSRTIVNVQTCDAVLVYGDIRSSGSSLTIALANQHKKPCIINPNIQGLKQWSDEHKPGSLMVAGNRLRPNNHHVMDSLIGLLVFSFAIGSMRQVFELADRAKAIAKADHYGQSLYEQLVIPGVF